MNRLPVNTCPIRVAKEVMMRVPDLVAVVMPFDQRMLMP